MKIAAVEAIAHLARVEASEVVAAAYGGAAPVFGPEYIIPKPFDPRLILDIAPAVAKAAMDSGVARRPIKDFSAYHRELERFVFRSGSLMRPVFSAATRDPKRIVYAEGENERVLRAAQTLIDDRIARPILLGRHDAIEAKVRDMGLRLDLHGAVTVLDPAQDRAVFDKLIPDYQRLAGRRGIPPESAAHRMGTRGSIAAAMMLHAGLADAAICGGTGDWWRQIQYILPIIPRRPDVNRVYALSALIIPTGSFFSSDNWLIENVGKIRSIPATLIHGRYDMVCPVENAWELHKAWPESELIIVPDAGHAAHEPSITDALITATDKYREI